MMPTAQLILDSITGTALTSKCKQELDSPVGKGPDLVVTLYMQQKSTTHCTHGYNFPQSLGGSAHLSACCKLVWDAYLLRGLHSSQDYGVNLHSKDAPRDRKDVMFAKRKLFCCFFHNHKKMRRKVGTVSSPDPSM
ncbi:hypothetical protein AV530_011794 [Patagioenas fasciata monilis]|uniref:Uncharacterized protein n=1 Tax=Patagioenas fasciata monilis TaxID=372326 RepID=A0A1V4KLT8_PATFA|nr:hypothetical protein AV530_011794 [Patagioenas fasciata monilis]